MFECNIFVFLVFREHHFFTNEHVRQCTPVRWLNKFDGIDEIKTCISHTKNIENLGFIFQLKNKMLNGNAIVCCPSFVWWSHIVSPIITCLITLKTVKLPQRNESSSPVYSIPKKMYIIFFNGRQAAIGHTTLFSFSIWLFHLEFLTLREQKIHSLFIIIIHGICFDS